MFKKVNPKPNFPKQEEEILKFWKKEKVFKKSIAGRSRSKAFSFYDGPPYATGLPHYGHLLAGTIKDVVPRYKTMQGYRVERVWGWDTHGLPIENIVEQELNFKTKIQIRDYGVDKFNEKCREIVLKYTKEWKKIVERTGRWVDIENAYITMDLSYMESVWWVFKSLWDKDLIYRGHKVMPYCPRCATGLSNFEVGMEYKDKTDKTVTVKFESEDEPGTFFLAWTTTPWTLPGNLALAVGKTIDYLKIEYAGAKYILAAQRLDQIDDDLLVFKNAEKFQRGEYSVDGKLKYKVLDNFKGKDLIGKKYKPLFSYYNETLRQAQGDKSKAFEVISGDFVSTEDGTGIVHIAPAFGEDDYNVAKEHDIDFFMPVDDLGHFTLDAPEYSGKSVIEFETNEQIINDLGDKVIKTEDYPHSYPHCWRCKTPLIYKAIDSWFVKVGKLKKDVLENNKKIHWVPGSIGKGRFQKMIESAPDWNISRNRFWGVPLPVWICKDCDERHVFGGVSELEKAAGEKVGDIHLHRLDGIKIKCKCGGSAELSGEVLDVWFDSGSMPYASIHYPFENKEKFERDFPADFIAEGIDQTRGWFNSLLMLGTAIFNKSPYKNVIVNGTVLAEDGQKMSKSLRNYPDPMEVVEKYGADSMRFYLMMSPAVRAEDLRFSEKGVDEIVKKVVLTLWNSYSFFTTYASLDKFTPKNDLSSSNVLDRWILSKTNRLIKDVTAAMEEYNLSASCRHLLEFMDELSNWYIRRSRKRFWKSENDSDKNAAYETLYFVLTTYIKLLAPFMPFVTEDLYQNLVVSIDKRALESIHLTDWPKANEKAINEKLEEQMNKTRQIIEMGLAQRSKDGIKVRQPLRKLEYGGEKLSEEQEGIISEEVNIKEVKNIKHTEEDEGIVTSVLLDTGIDPELKAEGIARDFVRSIQSGRKKAGFNVEDRIKTNWESQDKEIIKAIKKHSDYIAKETLSAEIFEGKGKAQYFGTIRLDGKEVWFGITKV